MWNRAGPPPPWPPRQPVPYGLPINLPSNPATWSPQMLVNVPSSTIDWALLARQWIAHRDSQPRHHHIPERLRAPIIPQPRSIDVRPPNFNAINNTNKTRPLLDMPKRPSFQPSVEIEPLKPLLQPENVTEQPYGFLDDSGIDQIDPGRRKQLPSWIREELEKMEKEKAKQAEKEKRDKEAEEKRKSAQKLFEDDSDKLNIIEGPKNDVNYSDGNVSDMEQSPQAVEKQPLSFDTILDEMNEEEREAIRLNFTRNALTEILLDVTNQLIASQASKCFEKAKLKAPAKQIAKSSALASITSLGLGYDSDSEKSDKRSGTSDESSTDEEQLLDRSDALLRKFKQKMLDPKVDSHDLDKRSSLSKDFKSSREELLKRSPNKETHNHRRRESKKRSTRSRSRSRDGRRRISNERESRKRRSRSSSRHRRRRSRSSNRKLRRRRTRSRSRSKTRKSKTVDKSSKKKRKRYSRSSSSS